PVVQPHPDAVIPLDDVVIGEQKAVGGEEDARAGPLPAPAAQVHDGGTEGVGDADDDARKGVEGGVLVGRRGRWGWVGEGAKTVADEVLPELRHRSFPRGVDVSTSL